MDAVERAIEALQATDDWSLQFWDEDGAELVYVHLKPGEDRRIKITPMAD